MALNEIKSNKMKSHQIKSTKSQSEDLGSKEGELMQTSDPPPSHYTRDVTCTVLHN